MSHATKSNRTPDGASPALCSGGLVRLRLRPCTLKEARIYVSRLHRHNKPPQGGLWAHAVMRGAELVGVAIVGRPVARRLDDGYTCEVTRLCTDGAYNACSMLYGAAARAAKAHSYAKIVTYTLASEPGTSLRASGWVLAGTVRGEASWSRPARDRIQTDLFGQAQRPIEDKLRWEKRLEPNVPVRRGGESEQPKA